MVVEPFRQSDDMHVLLQLIDRTLPAGVAYFLWVFGCGCVLGAIRVYWLEPMTGERTAALIEAP